MNNSASLRKRAEEVLKTSTSSSAMTPDVETLQLLHHCFTDFIHQSDQDTFYLFHQALINSKSFQSCELRLKHQSRADF